MSERQPAKTEKQASLFPENQAPDILRKAVQAVHIAPRSGRLGLQQRKMFSSLIKNAIRQNAAEPGRSVFSISVAALSRDIALNSNNTQYVKDTVNSLIGTVVNWDYLAQDKATVWKASGLLAGAELEQSTLRYSFSEQIRGELLNPEIYALIDMRIAREFRKSHSLALWENTVRYEAIGITARIPLQKFRDLILGQERGGQAYPEYKLFKSKVLLPCIREVGEVSDHVLELIEHKSGRSVLALQFRVTRKPGVPAGERLAPHDDGLLEQLHQVGIARAEARKLNAVYGEEHIRKALGYLSARAARKDIAPLASRASYLRCVLAQSHDAGTAAAMAFAPDAAAFPDGADAQDRLVVRRIEEAMRYVETLGAAARADLIARYNATVKLRELRLEHGRKPGRVAEVGFYQWVAKEAQREPDSQQALAFEAALPSSARTGPANPGRPARSSLPD